MQKEIRAMAARNDVADLLKFWQAGGAAHALAETISIQQIAAPTFDEKARADYVQARFHALQLSDISRDEMHNVYGRLPGLKSGPAVLVSAHLDTVFPHGTDLSVETDETAGQVKGAGIGDNAMGLGAMINLADALIRLQIRPTVDVWFVATVGEEGLGDLRGIKRTCDHLNGRIGQAIILEGIGLGRIYHAGMGVRRLRIAVQGPGGHSWLHAGRPSAIHHLMRIGAAIVEGVTPPKRPRSSLNIGLLSGGTSINTIAPLASCSVDLRSIDSAALLRMEAEVTDVLMRYDSEQELSVTSEVVGDRPSAVLSAEHPLVRAAVAVLRHMNAGPGSREIGSTDANVPLARRIPSVCIGITTGGGAHSAEEYIDTPPIATGMRQLSLLTMLATEHAQQWSRWDAGEG